MSTPLTPAERETLRRICKIDASTKRDWSPIAPTDMLALLDERDALEKEADAAEALEAAALALASRHAALVAAATTLEHAAQSAQNIIAHFWDGDSPCPCSRCQAWNLLHDPKLAVRALLAQEPQG